MLAAAFIWGGRYTAISSQGGRVYVVDRFTGSVRVCTQEECKAVPNYQLADTRSPLSPFIQPQTSLAPQSSPETDGQPGDDQFQSVNVPGYGTFRFPKSFTREQMQPLIDARIKQLGPPQQWPGTPVVKPVTDPALLEKLNAAPQRQPVTDSIGTGPGTK